MADDLTPPIDVAIIIGSTREGRFGTTVARWFVAEAERRYAERYRTPRPNPERVVIEITVNRLLGSLPG